MLGFLLAPSLAAQTAVLQIRAVEGEGAVQAAGARSSSPLAVLVTDEVGRPVEGAAVTFRLPEQGPGGTFSNGLRTEAARTGADGRARVSGIRWNSVPGPVRIRVTAVKDQARAGVVFAQYLSAKPVRRPERRLSLRSRWVALTAVLAGAAAAGFAAGRGGNPKPAAAAAAPPPLSIGPPVISVGKP